MLSLLVTLWVLGRPPIMPFIGGAVSISFGALTLITGDPMWVQIKVTLFNALVAFLLWIGLRAERNFFRFVFRKTFHYTEEGWHNLTRNAALFFLATAVANEAVRFGFADAHIIALNRVFTGIDIWISSRYSSSCPRRSCSSGGRSGFCRSTSSLTPNERGFAKRHSRLNLGYRVIPIGLPASLYVFWYKRAPQGRPLRRLK